jgi:hypothetical protein
MKIEGSGSISQRHGSADPDPDHTKMSWIRNTGFYILFMYPTVSCSVVDCHRFHAGSGAFHFNGDPDSDPTLFNTCWKIIMFFFTGESSSRLLCFIYSNKRHRCRNFQYFGMDPPKRCRSDRIGSTILFI